MSNITRYLNTITWISCLFLLSHSTFANPSKQTPSYTEANKTIQKLYHTLNTKPTPMSTRLNQVSRYFLNKPYKYNALGEGPNACYDQGPLYRTDIFDCETYIDTVVAIALSSNLDTFTQCIRHIRYQDGHVSFVTRNHFASIDWNFNNQKAGIFKDITPNLVDEDNKPVAKIATTVINKPNWYTKLPRGRIRLPEASAKEQIKKFEALKNEGKALKAETVSTPYIPLTALFDSKGRPNYTLFNQIPNGAIVEIVRPNWNLETQVGSHLNISHMGFVFRKNGELRFRHASLLKKKVSDMSLISYLKKTLSSPTIRGINIQVVVPNEPSIDNCG
ncbi:MAG: DUF1460 domain-containing protein [Gammaproteobacteria bacterium]|nr:DUF1460 domain-containing protein [Gammaproteobacteria bacterium]